MEWPGLSREQGPSIPPLNCKFKPRAWAGQWAVLSERWCWAPSPSESRNWRMVQKQSKGKREKKEGNETPREQLESRLPPKLYGSTRKDNSLETKQSRLPFSVCSRSPSLPETGLPNPASGVCLFRQWAYQESCLRPLLGHSQITLPPVPSGTLGLTTCIPVLL